MDDPKNWKAPSKNDLDFCKLVVVPQNYLSIARGLGIDLGPKAKPISYQVLNKKLKGQDIVNLENEKRWIDTLYSKGYDVSELWPTFVERIQQAILNTLPF